MSAIGERVPRFGIGRVCTKCKGDKLKQRGCMRCDSRGMIADCDRCQATGLLQDSSAPYGVRECTECGHEGTRPTKYAEMTSSVIPHRFCRNCGKTCDHRCVAGGVVCSACDKVAIG